jgi:polysaccharide deacetylase family protein (PEP-CTERM system associated)
MRNSAGARVNAMTVDVEDYFHVTAFAGDIDRSRWSSLESRVERNTKRLLDLFARHNTRATFFVLGWVAERHPGLVRELHAAGHEIACHGLTHEVIYRQTPAVFREETVRAKDLLPMWASSTIPASFPCATICTAFPMRRGSRTAPHPAGCWRYRSRP